MALPAHLIPDLSKLTVGCDGCERVFKLDERFFRCECSKEGFDLCLSCVLSKPDLSTKHGVMPCFLDARDSRPTFIPGPSASEFKNLVQNAREDGTFKFPVAFQKFLMPCNIDGISSDRLSNSENFESISSIGEAANTRQVMNNYSLYEKLDHNLNQIRIACLISGKPNDPISLFIARTAHPWTRPSYLALSYCWGPLDETRRIGVLHLKNTMGDGQKPEYTDQVFTCTVNLEIALRGLRKENENVFIWVDALCINQGDLEERAHQVSIMSQIYSAASCVAIWLHMAADEHLAMVYIRIMSRVFRQFRDSNPGKKITDQGLIRQFLASELVVEDHKISHDDLREKLSGFFLNPWFHRVWVLQEVASATSEVLAMSSQKTVVLWKDITLANLYLSIVLNDHRISIRGGLPSPWRDLEKSKDSAKLSFPRLPFLNLAQAACQKFSSTDPRDKLYALYAISEETHDMAILPPLISPDYSKPTWKVFADFTRWFIQEHQSLEVLGYATEMGEKTWKPGYNGSESEPRPSWSLWHSSKFGTFGTKLCELTTFKAAADMPMDLTVFNSAPNDRTIALSGYRLSTIEFASDFYFQIRWDQRNDLYIINPETQTFYTGGMRWLVGSAGYGDKPIKFCKPTGDGMPCSCQLVLDDILLALTLGGRDEFGCDHGPEPHNHEQHTKWREPSELYPAFVAHWKKHANDPNMDLLCHHVREILQSTPEENDTERLSRLLIPANRKAWASTESAKAGLVPHGTQKGDVVVALLGSRAPIVLRPRAEADTGSFSRYQEWELIGECYIREFMKGNKVSLRRDGGEQPEIFNLI